MNSALRTLLLLALALGAPPGAAQAPKAERLALVIGNSAYKDAPLPNPVNDAADMAKALEASGFTVLKRQNATLREMHLALREFGDRLGRRATGLVYFAGHGLQVRGRNYLLPVDADVAREDEVAFSAIDLGAVMEKLDSAKNPVNIVILDACRNNPFGNRIQPTAKGLAQVEAPPGTLIAFATAPGSTAEDGTGRNGLYTSHFVREMARPGAQIEEVFKAVRAAVRRDSQNRQVPWESTSLESNFAFLQPPPAPVPPPPKVAANAKGVGPAITRSAPVSLGAPPQFAVGDSWTYRVVNQIDQSVRTANYRITEIRGDEVALANGSLTDLVGNFTRIPRSGGRVETFKPSNYFYIFPMKPGIGLTFKSLQEIGGTPSDLEVKLRVIGEDEIDTPLGRMKALRVERESRWTHRGGKDKGRSGTRKWTYWYNSGFKRFVVAEETNTTADGKLLSNERFELVSFQLK
jgi:hypothetical protein